MLCFDFRQNVMASRRSFLQAGALGALGLNLTSLAQTAPTYGSTVDNTSRLKPAKLVYFCSCGVPESTGYF